MKRAARARTRRKPAAGRPPRPESAGGAILYRAEGPVAWIILNRPERKNALAGSMRVDLLSRIGTAESDPAIRAVVITGAGDAFCAGGDVGAMAALKERPDGFAEVERWLEAGGRIVGALAALSKPSVAALNGPAAGAGCNLALACDFRIAARGASLGETFIRVGLHPDWGGTYFLPRLIGPARALEMFATGEMISAEKALELGLVSRIVPASRLVAETNRMARRLAGAPVGTFLAAREAVRRSLSCSLSAMLLYEREVQKICWESADSGEGIRAFLEKRPPRFSGR